MTAVGPADSSRLPPGHDKTDVAANQQRPLEKSVESVALGALSSESLASMSVDSGLLTSKSATPSPDIPMADSLMSSSSSSSHAYATREPTEVSREVSASQRSLHTDETRVEQSTPSSTTTSLQKLSTSLKDQERSETLTAVADSEAQARRMLDPKLKHPPLATDHPILKQDQILDVKRLTGTGARSGVYLVKMKDGSEYIVKPLNQGYLNYNNPTPENAKNKSDQAQPGIQSNEFGENGVIAFLLAQSMGLEHLTPREDFVIVDVNSGLLQGMRGPIPDATGITQSMTLCTVQPRLEGKTLERIFRDFAKQHIDINAIDIGLVAKYAVDDGLLKNQEFVSQYLAALKAGGTDWMVEEDEVADELIQQLSDIMKLGSQGQIDQALLENKELVAAYMKRMEIVPVALVDKMTMRELDWALGQQDVAGKVDGLINQVIEGINKDDFDDVMLLLLVLGEQDGNLGNFLLDPTNRLFKIDNGGTLSRAQGFLKVGLENFSTHGSYFEDLTPHFKGKIKAIDLDKQISIMQANGKDDATCEIYRKRVELLKILTEVEGMNPEQLVIIMESPIFSLKEKGFDLLPLLFQNKQCLAGTTKFRSEMKKIVNGLIKTAPTFIMDLWNKLEKETDRYVRDQIGNEIRFSQIVHGMLLDKENKWGVEDLYAVKGNLEDVELTDTFDRLVDLSNEAINAKEAEDS